MPRAVRLIPPILGMIVAVALVAFGASETRFDCARVTGRCTFERKALAGTQRREFPIERVREVRFVDGLAKNKTDGETVIVFSTGDEFRFARAKTSEARVTYEDVHAFFGERGPEAVHYAAKSGVWTYVFGGVILLGSFGFGISEWHKPVVARPPRTPDERAKKRRRVWWIVGGIAVLAISQLLFVLLAARGEGTVVLRCKQRCKFMGGECLPGGSMEASLEPGDYPIEIWASSGQELWIPRRLTIKAGETTTFTCAE